MTIGFASRPRNLTIVASDEPDPGRPGENAAALTAVQNALDGAEQFGQRMRAGTGAGVGRFVA